MTAWGASLGAADLLPAFGAPAWAVRVFVACAVLGLPIAIVLAWAYEITPRGIVETRPIRRPEARPQRDRKRRRCRTAMGSIRASARRPRAHEKVFGGDFDRPRRGPRDPSRRPHDQPPARGSQPATACGGSRTSSRNGTLVDGQRVTRIPLPPSCEVRLYETAPVLRTKFAAAQRCDDHARLLSCRT